MGSIPLPALHIQPPPAPENPVDQFGRILQLRNALQEAPLRQQALQQQVQQGQIGMQEAQQGQKDQEAFRAAMADPSLQGKTLSAIADHLAKTGNASPQMWQSLKKADVEQRQSLATLDKDQLANFKAAHSATQELYNNVMNLPDDQLAQNWPQIAQQYDSIPGNNKMPLDPQKPLSKDQLKAFGPFISMHGAYLDEAMGRDKTKAQTDEATARANEATVNAGLAPQKLATQQANEAATLKQGQQRISIEGARLNFDRARQGTQDQQAIEAQAQQIASGEVKGISQARNNPFARSVMARVYEINPKYSDSLYTATQDLRSSKPTSMGGNVGRLGTAILHADESLSHSKDLGFSEGLLTGVGTSGTAAYKQAAEFLTGEIGQYVTGGKLTVDEGKKLSSDLMSSRQGVRDAALNEIITLSKGKLQSQMGQYKNATQNDFPTDRVFNDPSIKSALEKHGVIGGATPSSGSVVRYKIVNGQLVAQ